MAIAFDTTSSGAAAPGTSITFSHTCTGSDLILLVGVNVNGKSTDVVSGVTYNSVAMTRIDRQANSNESIVLYYLINPSTGANNVVVSLSESSFARSVSGSYTGAKQSSQPDASGKNVTTGATSLAASATVVASNCWLVGVIGNNNAFDMTISSGSERVTLSNVISLGDSDGVVSTGSQSQTWTFSSQRAQMIVASIAPVAVDGGGLLTLGVGS